jgi:hypothetical protein
MLRKNLDLNPVSQESPTQEDDLLTAEKARAATFLLAEPRGYYHVQVDAFVLMVERSILAWENRALYLEQLLHEAQVEIDRLGYENQSLRAQIEVFRVNGSPVVDAHGNYLTEAQAASAGGLLVADGARLTTEIDRLSGENTELLTQIVELHEQVIFLGGVPQVYGQSEIESDSENYEDVAFKDPYSGRVPTGDKESAGTSEPVSLESAVSDREIPNVSIESPKSGRLWGRKRESLIVAPRALAGEVLNDTNVEGDLISGPARESTATVFGTAENSWEVQGSD